MNKPQNNSLGEAAAPLRLFTHCRAHAGDPQNPLLQQELLNALYPELLRLIERVVARTGCGSSCADELLERIRIRALEKNYLVRNPRITQLLTLRPSAEVEEELRAAIQSVALSLAYWEAARLRKRGAKFLSFDETDRCDEEIDATPLTARRTMHACKR